MAVSVIIFGTPGAGKSSIAKQLALLRPDTQIYDSDVIAHEILTLTDDADVAFDVASTIFIQNFLFNQYSTGVSVFTDSLSTMKRINNFRDLSCHKRVLFFRVFCPIEVALERVNERQTRQLVHDTQDSLQLKMDIINRIDFNFTTLNNGRGSNIIKNAIMIDEAIEHLLADDRSWNFEAVKCR